MANNNPERTTKEKQMKKKANEMSPFLN